MLCRNGSGGALCRNESGRNAMQERKRAKRYAGTEVGKLSDR